MEQVAPRNFVGENIRRFRAQRSWTQEQLAAKCEVMGIPLSRGTLAKIEAGIRGASDFEVFVFARVLHVSLEALFPKNFSQRLKETFAQVE